MSDRTFRGVSMEDFYLKQATGVDPMRGGGEWWEHAVKAANIPDGPPQELPADAEMDQIYRDPRKDLATYKIEIRFGADRSHFKDSHLARIDLWISGRMLAGGGDDHMFICGYPDCGKPIPSDNVGHSVNGEMLAQMNDQQRWAAIQGHWAVCSSCAEAGKNNLGKQACSIEAAGFKLNRDSNRLEPAMSSLAVKGPQGEVYPCLKDCIILQASSRVIAELLARYWRHLDGNADIYMKYHPLTMKKQQQLGAFEVDRPVWDKADRLVVYPVANIIKDTVAGASLVNRFKAFINA